jgi:ribonuclease III
MTRSEWAHNKLDYRFKDPSLLELALTHRSASKRNNERLEFLGDGFLNFLIARELYEQRPEASEGDMSRLRATLVRRSTLAAIGHEIDLQSQIVVGAGEVRSGGAARSSVVANTLEALIGAVLVDGGVGAAEHVVRTLMSERLASLPAAESLKDSKTRLQEWLQARGLALPVYRVDSVTGRSHEQTFTVVCEAGDRGLTVNGRGPSRRRAEQDAAAAMLVALTNDH